MGRGFLSVDGIRGDQGTAEVQSIQEIFERGNFVGLGRDLDLSADDSGLGIQGAEQLEGLAVDFGGGADAFTIDGQGGNAQVFEVGTEPVTDQTIQFNRIQALQDAPDRAFAGRQEFASLAASRGAQGAELVLIKGLRKVANVAEGIVIRDHARGGNGHNGSYFAMEPTSVAAGIA